jgi:hypothetical protein
MSGYIHVNNPCIVVKGANWGDAEFYGKWLLAAAQAETFWKEAYCLAVHTTQQERRKRS